MKPNKLPGVSVFVLHYNDAVSSSMCLKSLYKNLPKYPGPYELYLIDNGSTDDSVDALKKEFPKLKVIGYGDHLQVGKSFARAAIKAKYDLLYLTPNDMEADPDFLEPLVRHFRREDVFAVNPTALSKNENESYRRNVASRRFGLFSMYRRASQKPAYSFSPAILGAFNRKKFLEFGGPDPLYHPTFYDDYDLGFCAWKRGWKVIYEPKSIVMHRHKGQLKKVIGERESSIVDMRNRHLFIWKNYDNVSFVGYMFYLPFILLLGTLKRGPDYIYSFCLALKKVSDVREKRRKEERVRKYSDSEIFAMCSGHVNED
ncbi:MAG: glycosyltransferase [Candidatus Micrarchaeota archaeon]